MKQKVPLSGYSLSISVAVLAVLSGIVLLELKKGEDELALFAVAIMLMLCIMALVYMPLSVSIDEKSLNIHRSLAIKSIPLGEIKSVMLCPPTISERRICGSGGWFGLGLVSRTKHRPLFRILWQGFGLLCCKA